MSTVSQRVRSRARALLTDAGSWAYNRIIEPADVVASMYKGASASQASFAARPETDDDLRCSEVNFFRHIEFSS